MGLSDLGPAVVGPHVPVDVEQPDRLGVGGDMMSGERHAQLVGPVLGGELRQAEPEALDLGGPVQTQQATDGGGIEPGHPLGPGLTGQTREHHKEDEGTQAVEGGAMDAAHLAARSIHRSGSLDEPGGRQCRQDQQRAHQRERTALTDHRGRFVE
jgi:hypothetical protein